MGISAPKNSSRKSIPLSTSLKACQKGTSRPFSSLTMHQAIKNEPRMRSQHGKWRKVRPFSLSLSSSFISLPLTKARERTGPTTQVGHDRKKRMENLRNAFAMRHSMDVRARHLILIDDVLTTGSTLDECARALVQGGAESVRAITVARG